MDVPCLTLFIHVKIAFFRTALWAYPVIGKLFERCPWRNLMVGISLFGVIDVTAKSAHIFFHFTLGGWLFNCPGSHWKS